MMKNPMPPRLKLPMLAICLGAFLLLGVLLSYRFLFAMTAVFLIGWGIWRWQH